VIDFLAEVNSGEFDKYSGAEALTRARVVDACYASAEKGTEVSLS
jgi:predicted dehydrogenase